MKAKPNANTRTLRPDKCLVVPSLSAGLRPDCPRNTAANAVTTREPAKACATSVCFLFCMNPTAVYVEYKDE
jgi:hypothetical protein